MVFLSEPQVYSCDISALFSLFNGRFGFHLNSEDTFCPDLPLTSRRAKGGTMAMWASKLDPHVKILPTATPAVLPLLLSPPGLLPTAHITVYLPTAGKDAEFLSEFAALDAIVSEILEDFACPIYIRGDFNANPKNLPRARILQHFCEKFSFTNLDLGHSTHHHFMGDGISDSQLDLLLFRGPPNLSESLDSIACSLDNPLVTSHHDLVLSSFSASSLPPTEAASVERAPRVPNDRVKICWSEDGSAAFESLVSPSLSKLRDSCISPSSPATFDILLDATNYALSHAAQATCKSIKLGQARSARPSCHPEVKAAQRKALDCAHLLRLALRTPSLQPEEIQAAKSRHTAARALLKQCTKMWLSSEALSRDQRLSSILTSKPSSVFSFLRSAKSGTSKPIQKLKVSEKIYTCEHVPDGFYDSLSALKCPDMSGIHASSSYQAFNSDYKHIMAICRAGLKIPELSGKDASLLLHSLKADVNDLQSITANHYIHAGLEGALHFKFLLNTIINNVNLSSIDRLNEVWAMILFKGHNKDRESDRSYRTISTCPFLSKALDKYVGGLCESGWAAAQAETQFQGTGSSHELAALLLTETIQHSLYVSKQPVYVLLLDAQSAFDKILRELCIRAAFLAGTSGESLVFFDNRLKNRKTYIEWCKTLMGPIPDQLGVEQGGVNSDRFYKLANNSELQVTQRSQLGVHLGPVHVASIGQADDVALVSNCPYRLQGLLTLAMEYATSHHIQMVASKTKLLRYVPSGHEQYTTYFDFVSPVAMLGSPISFSLEAEHVGIMRCSAAGSMAAVLARISSHTRAMHAVLPAGSARGHFGNPAASLRVELLYGLPVLLSGLASLVLSRAEVEAIDHHYKVSLERLLRLYPRTPACFVYLLAGSLPASAILHKRQLSLLGMIARQGDGAILHRYGHHILTNPPLTSRSPSSSPWFIQVRGLCRQYGLPDPLEVLSSATSKGIWKGEVERAINSYWGARIRAEATALPSISHLRPSHMSLSSPSPLLTTCRADRQEIKKMTVQVRMASGRYRTCWLRRYWSGDDTGSCRVPGCLPNTPGTLLHLATGQCVGLKAATSDACSYWATFATTHPHLYPLLQFYADGEDEAFLAFLLSPHLQAPVLLLAQEVGNSVFDEVCHMTRTWLYQHHRARLRSLDLWEYLV